MSFVLHVGVVGFHHQLGNQVEMLYPPVFLPSPPPALLPPFDRSPETSPTPSSSSSAIQRVESTPRGTTTTSSSSTSSSHALMRKTSTGQSIDRVFVPQLWQCLPFYALPDGAHGVEEDFVCVSGPRPHEPCIPIAIDTSGTHTHDLDEQILHVAGSPSTQVNDIRHCLLQVPHELPPLESLMPWQCSTTPSHSHAHRQVTLKGVQVITPEISRGRIQKSVCVLSSQVPSLTPIPTASTLLILTPTTTMPHDDDLLDREANLWSDPSASASADEGVL